MDNPVQLANQQVPISYVLRQLDVYVPDIEFKSSRVYCPFGDFYHVDGGMSKAMRVYPDTNTGYCFAGCGYMTSVSLYAQAKDLSKEQAAKELLERTGFKPETAEEQWERLVSESIQVDREALASALKVWCARLDSKWQTRQFEPGVAHQLAACLGLVEQVFTQEEADQWLKVAKIVMKRELDKTSRS